MLATHHLKRRSIFSITCLLFGLVFQTQATQFQTPVAVAASGMAGEGIALFVPGGLDAQHLPTSLALLAAPKIAAPLPGGWNIKPVFTRDGNRHEASVSVPDGTDLHGGGEVTGPLRRNGQSITLWNTDNYMYAKHDGKRLYQSHPWILGVRPDGSAFGVLFDSTWKAELACNREIDFTSQGPAFPVLVIDRDSPQAVLKGLAGLTGTMPLPPRWALGYHQCRWSYNPDSRVREIAGEFRKRQIPCDVIWMDIDYMNGFRVFTFDKNQFPDPKNLNDDLHAQGFRSIWMIDPGVKADPDYSIYQSGQKNDVFVKTAAGNEFNGEVWPGACAFPDFTRPETRTWWAGLYKDYMATGIDGVWNDMNEPAVFNSADDTMPEDNRHRGGGELPAGPHLQYHNAYGMLMTKASRDGIQAANPEKRPFVLTRANFLGGQRYAATWTGDNASTEKHLNLSTPMTLTLGLSGQPFNGADIGGFGEKAAADLWARWIGIGAFYPFSRGHACKATNDKDPWAFGPAVEKTARIALERRYRLLPYLYTLFEQSSRDGLPIMRPVFLADPKDSSLRAEEQAFLSGDDLLVVPRRAENAKIPKGDWREVSLIPGDLDDTNQPSLRIRSGAIIPLGKIVQNTGEKSLDPLTLLVCTDSNGKANGSLYEDAGDGYGYETGDFRRTTFHAETKDGKVVVTASSDGERKPECPEFVVQVVEKSPAPEFGAYFQGKGDKTTPLPAFAQVKDQLPEPLLASRPQWLAMYWKCWELGFSHLKTPPQGSPLVSSWLDDAFAPDIFQWDTCFMMMFARYAHAQFPAIQSLDNFYARQRQSGYICRELGQEDKAAAYAAEADAIGARINQWCWNEQDGFYYDVLADGTQFKKKTSGGFWPMIAGIASSAQVKRLVAHLKDEKEFWRPFVFPTLAADEPEYVKPTGNYWLGGVWAPTNYAIIKGLEACGEEAFATEASTRYIAAMAGVFQKTGTVWENYAPEIIAPGKPAAGDFVGWTGIGPITLLIENVLGFRPDGARNTLTWNLHLAEPHGIKRLRFGSVTADLLYDGVGSVSITASAPFTLMLNGKTFDVQQGTSRLAASHAPNP